jgi:CHAD domain-containing protein
MRSGPVLRRVFDKRHRALDKHLAAALEGDGNAVHQARVATRRLREALPVVGAGLMPKRVKKLRNRMRKLGRLLGGVRERDVALGMLDQRQTNGVVASPAGDRVRLLLQHGREDARTTLTETLDEQKIARWMQDLELFDKELHTPDLPEDSTWRVVLARRLLKRTEALHVAMNEAGTLFVSERLHAIRVAMKRVRYAVELASELGGRKLDAVLNELKAGQDTLGELHDIDVLMGYVNHAIESAPADQAVHASLEALLTKLEAERHDLHARYLTHQPQLLALVDRIQDHIVPRFTMARAMAHAHGAAPQRKPSSRGAAAV